MGSSVGGNKGFVSEINVTPFVDVMLVLLIIFMVTAPMMTCPRRGPSKPCPPNRTT